MQEYQNSDPSVLNDSISSQHPKLNSSANRFDSTQSGGIIPAGIRATAGGRVEANTALIKIGQNSGEHHSPFESDSLLDGNSGITPPEDDEEGGEATSARIAQEYRRQVRIKRLAEEIQQAEREKKKEEELRRKTETQLRKTNSTLKKKNDTAKFEIEEATIAPPTEIDVNIAKKRAVAMSAFKNVAQTRKSRAGLLVVLIIIFVISLSVGGGWVFLNKLANQRAQAVKDEDARRALATTQAAQVAQQKAVQDVNDSKAREAELARQKLAVEEVAHKAEAEKHALEERVRAKVLEQQKAFLAETARRAAEDRRLREENDKVVAQANREKEELRAKIEEAQRVSHEKLKKQQDDEAVKAAVLATQAAATAKAEVLNIEASKAVAAAETPKELPNPDATQPQAVKNSSPKDVQTSSNDGKTTTTESAALLDKSDRLDLPSGGVRLLVKASDPYGGKLAFQWRQVKGELVDIVDPAASKFIDGKWVSQTYFVAHQPGSYEFEVIVKNDDGVESKRKFPIEVLPPTTLK